MTNEQIFVLTTLISFLIIFSLETGGLFTTITAFILFNILIAFALKMGEK
jgi:hypothetical protein